MLAYFPKAYPGELLYSVLARYHRHVGMPGPMHTLDALFGNRKVIASADLPGHLQSLTNRMPVDCELSVDHMIDTLTLFPYFTAFEPPSLRAKVRTAMRSGSIDGMYMQLGLAAFRVGRNRQLNFCRECIQTMYAMHDELWWRRDHQLPGILVCPEHGCALQESTVSFPQYSRHEFIAATSENCSTHARLAIPVVDHACLAHLQRIAQSSADLLTSPPVARTLSGWTTFYRNHMLEAGLAKSLSTMDQPLLGHEFRNFYGRALALWPAVMADGHFAGDWLATMVRKHRKANHPLYHILLQDFLGQRERHVSPFGAGPWPCLNPLANHYSQPVIRSITQHRNHVNFVGVFACHCGYTYTRCFKPLTRELGKPRFLRFGPLLEPELRRLIVSGAGLREMSRFLMLDPKTVMRLASEIGIVVEWKTKQSTKVLSVVPKPETPSKHTLSSINTTSSTPAIRYRVRHDWLKIDLAWAAKLSALAHIVRAEMPPVRITVAELERRVQLRGWLLKRLHRLPATMTVLELVVEKTEDFQRRRIDWAIAELERSGAQIKAWQVMRKAGLSSSSLDKIKAILDAAPFGSRNTA
jgi:hypothetical protein